MSGVKEFLGHLLALRITDGERQYYSDDAYNIFGSSISRRRPMRVATALGILFHLLVLFLVWPQLGGTELPLDNETFVIKQLARPAKLSGAQGSPVSALPKPKPVVPKPKPKFVPIPDPSPDDPEPVLQATVDIPRILEELSTDLGP